MYHLDVELMDIADIQALGDKVLRQLYCSVMLLMPKGWAAPIRISKLEPKFI